MAALSWPEFCKLWKDYTDAMGAAIVEAAGSSESPAGQRLARLVYETGAPGHRNLSALHTDLCQLLVVLEHAKQRPSQAQACRAWAKYKVLAGSKALLLGVKTHSRKVHHASNTTCRGWWKTTLRGAQASCAAA